eukprot:2648-Heterococcus_DN1.PRE.2
MRKRNGYLVISDLSEALEGLQQVNQSLYIKDIAVAVDHVAQCSPQPWALICEQPLTDVRVRLHVSSAHSSSSAEVAVVSMTDNSKQIMYPLHAVKHAWPCCYSAVACMSEELRRAPRYQSYSEGSDEHVSSSVRFKQALCA